MTKQEFLYRLAQQLMSLPPEERLCALKFYDEYFADAGEENWEAVMTELGSPEEVARTIKEDFAQRNPGYRPNAESNSQYAYRPGPRYQPGQGRQTYTTNPQDYGGPPAVGKQKGMSGGSVALIVTLLILGSPIWITLLAVAFALAIGLIAVIVGLAAAAVAVTLALVIGGVACAWGSITALALTPGPRLLGLGGGLVFTGIGLLAALLGLWLILQVVPGVFRWLVDLFRKPFHRKGGSEG